MRKLFLLLLLNTYLMSAQNAGQLSGRILDQQTQLPIQGVTVLLDGTTIGVATNRSREFFQHELRTVDDGSWPRLVDLSTCADDVTYYKPDPQVIRYALAQIDTYPRPETWYIGDSYLDIVTGREAGVTAIFYNGGCRTPQELKTLFGDDPRYQPDAIINSFEELMDLLEAVQRDNPSAFEKIVSKARPPAFPAPEPPPQHIEPDWHPSVAQLIPPSIILFWEHSCAPV